MNLKLMVFTQKIIYLKCEYESIGTHWMALHVNGNDKRVSYDAIYFDSFEVEYIPK